MKSRNFKLVLEYDGAPFHGFQRQPHRPTVQEALETALRKLFQKKIKIGSASGRTDSGVHAAGQVVHFPAPTALEPRKIRKALNYYLPESIAVKEVEEVPRAFHARYSAKSKTYEYRIWNHEVRSPLHARSAAHIPYALDLAKMRKAAKFLTGRRDFRAFCGGLTPMGSDPSRGTARRAPTDKKNTVRTVKRFVIKKEGSLLRFIIEADGFLYHMVRNLIGTLVETGRGKMSLTELKAVLHSKDRRLAGATAPSHGLCLVGVCY